LKDLAEKLLEVDRGLIVTALDLELVVAQSLPTQLAIENASSSGAYITLRKKSRSG
jgi:hypothetical protein